MMLRDMHNEIIVIDALEASAWDRETLQELRSGGLTAVHVTIAYWENARQTLSNIADWHQLLAAHADMVIQVRSAADIEFAKRTGRTGIIFGFQNCSPIEDDIGLVRVFHDLGVRIMQLTYNNQSLLGAGCYESVDSGITRFGREVIREMNRVGMVIDLSHSGEKTSLQAIRISDRPVAITHANPLWFHKSIRNKSDRLLDALARSGGMLGFSTYPMHIGGSNVSLDSFCEMISDTAEILGIDRIGLGTDMCRNHTAAYLDWMRSGRWTREPDKGEASAAGQGWPEWPAWFRSPADMGNLTEGLARKGFSSEEIVKVMGDNWFRFFRDGFSPA